MKKFILITVCIIMMSMTASADTFNKAMLVHNGQVTLYDSDKVQDAINAASDGDVIYLTLGTFKPFNVTKKITIRGVGETSIVDGDVTISIPGSPKLTSPVLEALSVAGKINVGSQVDDMIIRKCKITNFTIGAQVDGAVLDRCYITSTLILSSYIKGMTVVNTKLFNVIANSGATQNTTFVNCNLYRLYVANFSGTILNSVIYLTVNSNNNTGYDNSKLLSTVLFNTLLYTNNNYVTLGSSSVAQNCYYQSARVSYSINNSTYYGLLKESCECAFDKSGLQSNGYLGTDGTVVGIEGGETPFTLEPSVPKVTSSDVKLDNDKKQLNVKLTVSPQ